MKYSQIFFDLDGPILDISQRYYLIYSNLLKEKGFKAISKEEYWKLKREQVPEKKIIAKTCNPSFVKYYLEKRKILIENFDYLKHDVVWEGTKEILSKLRDSHELYLVSMRNNRLTLIKELRHFNIMSKFIKVLNKDNNQGNWKVKYDLIREYLVNDKNSVIIGDTEADIIAGKKLGIKTCALTCGIRTPQKLKENKPDLIFGNLESFFKNYSMHKINLS